MFAVTLDTETPPYVTGYCVASPLQYRALHSANPHMIYVNDNNFTGMTVKHFMQNFWRYYLANGELALDINR